MWLRPTSNAVLVIRCQRHPPRVLGALTPKLRTEQNLVSAGPQKSFENYRKSHSDGKSQFFFNALFSEELKTSVGFCLLQVLMR